jgi:hypothetical protein
MTGDILNIPHFISAGSKQALRRAFLLNNTAKSKMFQYYDIQQEKDGTWTAWYYDKISAEKELKSGSKSKSNR